MKKSNLLLEERENIRDISANTTVGIYKTIVGDNPHYTAKVEQMFPHHTLFQK